MSEPNNNNHNNPLENVEVKTLLAQADTITSAHDFGKWQKSFLEAFTQFLDTDGSAAAQAAYQTFSTSSTKLFKIVKVLQQHVDAGNITTERTSVKGRKSISELGSVLNSLVNDMQMILPTTSTQIKSFGFTKYHMGAVLVDDGFTEYAVMQLCQALLAHVREAALDAVASRQVLEEIDYFAQQFAVFCGVMESLNLMKVCQVAQQYLHAELVLTNDLPPAVQAHIQAAQAAAAVKVMEPTTTPPPPPDILVSEPAPRTARAPQQQQTNFDRSFTVSVTYPEDKKLPPKEEAPASPPTPTKSDRPKSAKKSTPKKAAAIPKTITNDNASDDDDSSFSSYETVETIVTVSSYEEVPAEHGANNKNDDDASSSYETIVIVSESEYETCEEEVVVSDYVTDSDSGSDNDNNNNSKKVDKPKKKSKPKTKNKPDPSPPNAEKKKTKKAPAAKKKKAPAAKDESPSTRGPSSNTRKGKPKGGSPLTPPTAENGASNNNNNNEGGQPLPPPPPNNNDGPDSEGEKEEDNDDAASNNSSSDSAFDRGDGRHGGGDGDGKEDDGDDDDDYDGDSKSQLSIESASSAHYDPNEIRIVAAKAPDSAPASPTNNTKPVQRIQFTAKDFYHGHDNGGENPFEVWKQFKNDTPERKAERKAKRMKRIERMEMRTTRVKVKERTERKVRQKTTAAKKDENENKLPMTVRIRHTHHVKRTKRVKKEKPPKD